MCSREDSKAREYIHLKNLLLMGTAQVISFILILAYVSAENLQTLVWHPVFIPVLSSECSALN